MRIVFNATKVELKVTQLCAMLLLIYEMWYIPKFDAIPYVLQGLTLCLLLSVLGYYTRHLLYYNKAIPKELSFWWMLVGIYSIVVGAFVAINKNYFVDCMITYFAFLVICIICAIISYECKNIDWIWKTIIFADILCALSCIFDGYDYATEVIVTTMGPNNNPNLLGINMVLGLAGIMYCFKTLKTKWIAFVGISLFTFIIVICGSRKALLAAIVLIMLWIVFEFRIYFKHIKPEYKIIYIIITTIIVFFFSGYIINMYLNSGSFERMVELLNGWSNNSRLSLYKTGWKLFKDNILFGIGFGQYKVVAGYNLYSHSTYIESLSCLGLFGSILYFVPYIKLMFFYINSVINRELNSDKRISIMLFVVLLFLGIGMIHFYELSVMIALSTLFMYKNKDKISWYQD